MKKMGVLQMPIGAYGWRQPVGLLAPCVQLSMNLSDYHCLQIADGPVVEDSLEVLGDIAHTSRE